jgi:maltooligosyltrehalose trehalohydrolase
LVEGIRQGRKKEFEKFRWKEEPDDPQIEETFFKSKIDWTKRQTGDHKILLNYYRELIHLRKNIDALSNLDKESMIVRGDDERKVITVERWHGKSRIMLVINMNGSDVSIHNVKREQKWKKILDSSNQKWNGPGTLLTEYINEINEVEMRAHSIALYEIDNG